MSANAAIARRLDADAKRLGSAPSAMNAAARGFQSWRREAITQCKDIE